MPLESCSPTPPDLICPEDGERLLLGEGAAHYRCPRCEARYPVEKGVVRFLRDTDSFYEGRYLNTIRFIPRRENPFYAWPLWQMASGYIWAARAHVPAGATVVEVGCASGVAYFAHRRPSRRGQSAWTAGGGRAGAKRRTLRHLPSGRFHGVTAAARPIRRRHIQFIRCGEHIAPELKPRALAEFAAVACCGQGGS